MREPMDLDDVNAIKSLDSMGLFRSTWGLPDQCRHALGAVTQNHMPASRSFRNLVVAGLGGSAIGGDLLRFYGSDRLSIPVVVNRSYELPQFVGPDTLIFVVSYSGNTAETLNAYADARARGAEIIVLTSGGRLGELARRDRVPLVRVPGGIAPRAATGYLLIPMLVILERLGLIGGVEVQVMEAVKVLRGLRVWYGPDSFVMDNPAKQLAMKLEGHLPVIWGASGTTEVVAQRWKGQINENAKAPSYWNVLPELSHNEIVGFGAPVELLGRMWLVLLRDTHDHPKVQRGFEVSKTLIGAVAGVSEVSAVGDGPLARMLSLVYLGDYVSLYLACRYGINPGPVEAIDCVKASVASVQTLV